MIYTLQYLDDHNLMTIKLNNKSVRKVNDTLFLVKIKRNITKPRLIQIKHNFRASYKKDWWLCEVKQSTKELIILQFHKGEDVWTLLNNKD